jgi:hypothetical protein
LKEDVTREFKEQAEVLFASLALKQTEQETEPQVQFITASITVLQN